jgi:hypothetical protein
VTNPEESVSTLEAFRVSPDVFSLFKRVPLKDVLNLYSRHFDEDNVKRFQHVPTSSFLCLNGQVYEETDEVATGFPLHHVIAKFYMHVFGEEALKKAAHKPLCWFTPS